MRIIFMGTPDFAVSSLQALVEHNFDVAAVVTATDKRAGRGNKVITSAVKDYALSKDLPVLQPPNLKAPEFVEELRSYGAELQIVVAFRMLPEVVWNMPQIGTINLHASLLPEYRGAAPINWAIINGETETGVSTFFLRHEIDTGDIIFQEKEPIYPDDDFGLLYGRLRIKGASLVIKTVEAVMDRDYPRIPQNLGQAITKAPKIRRETGQIHWEKSSEEIHNLIRGLSPIPAAWTSLLGKNCKIYRSSLEVPRASEASDDMQVGEYFTDNKKFLYFKTGDGWLAIESLQLEGKKRMDIGSFLAGNKL